MSDSSTSPILKTVSIFAACCGLGFLVGWVGSTLPDRVEGDAEEQGGSSEPGRSLTALGSGSPSHFAAVRQVRRSSKSFGSASNLLQYLELVRELPVGELGDFLIQVERQMPGEYLGLLLRGHVMDRMLAEDPQQAFELLLSRRSHYAWLERNNDIIARMAEVDFSETWDRIENLPTGHDDRANYLAHLAGVWARDHTDSAIELVEGMGVRERKALLSNHHHFSKDHPEWAIDLALRSPPSGEVDELLGSVVYEWSGRDPVAVIAKINDIDNHARKLNAVAHLASAWSQADMESAVAYATEISSPKLRDHFVRSLEGDMSDDQRRLLVDSISNAKERALLQRQLGLLDLHDAFWIE